MSNPEGDTIDDTEGVDPSEGLRRAREALGSERRVVIATGRVASEGLPVMGETILPEDRSTIGTRRVEKVEVNDDLL